MIKIFASDFEYDNAKLSDYGFIICQFDASNSAEVTNVGSTITFNQIPINRGRSHPLVSTQYDECLTVTFDICKDPCSTNYTDNGKITFKEERSLFRWLNRRQFNKFRFITENNEDTKVWYMAAFNIEEIRVNDILYGLRLTAVTDKPYGIGETQTEYTTYTSVSASDDATENYVFIRQVLSDEIGRLPIKMKITLGNISLARSYDLKIQISESIQESDDSINFNQEIVINNCSQGETITIDGENEIITSDDSNHKIYNDFNYKFPYFLIKNGSNKFAIRIIAPSSSCTGIVKVEYAPIIKGLNM